MKKVTRYLGLVCLMMVVFSFFLQSASSNVASAQTASRVITVSSAGSATQNGQALIDAMNSITGATSSTPWLVRLEPGQYDLGSQELQMKSFVDLEGAGEDVTTISGTSYGHYRGTVKAASNSEIRFVTVYNSTDVARVYHTPLLVNEGIENFSVFKTTLVSYGPTAWNHALRNLGANIKISNSTLNAFGGTTTDSEQYGLISTGNYTTTVTNSKLTASATAGAVKSIARGDYVAIIKVATSELGAPVAGVVKCIGSYNSDFNPLNAACQ